MSFQHIVHVQIRIHTGMFSEGFMVFTVAVVAMQLKVACMSVTPTGLFWAMIALSLAGYILFTYLYGLFPGLDWYNTVPITFAHPEFWLAIFIIPTAMWLMDSLIDTITTHLDPSSRDKLVALLAAHPSSTVDAVRGPRLNSNTASSTTPKGAIGEGFRDSSMSSRDLSDGGSKEDEASGGGVKLSTISTAGHSK